MRTSIWYRTEEKQPNKSGYYLSYRGFGMGGMNDYDSANGYMYYDVKQNEWREYESLGSGAIVYYWTTATPDDWVDADPPSTKIRANYNPKSNQHTNVTLQAAWADVEEAVKRYETIRALVQEAA